MNKIVQIQLPAPCTQSWEDMQPVPGGKFCSSCEKQVIDFSLLNDRQIIEILRKTRHGCGRFTDEQLNRDLVISNQSNVFIPAVIVSTALAAGMTTAAHAAPLPQDTSVTSAVVKDSLPAEEIPGYYALKEDFVVTAYTTTLKTYTVGGFIGVIKKEPANKVSKHLSFFRRILIALRLVKKPA